MMQSRHGIKTFGCLSLIFLAACGHLKEARRAYESADYARTITLCLQAVAFDSTDADAFLLLGKTYVRTDSLSRAETALLQARKLNPQSRSPIRNLAELYQTLGTRSLRSKAHKDAVYYLEKAEEMDPLKGPLMESLADAYKGLAWMNRAESAYTGALESGQDTASVNPKLRFVRQRISQGNAEFEKGMQALKENRLNTAHSHLKKSYEANSDPADVRYQYYMAQGRILYRKGSVGALWEAIEAFGKASMIRTDSAEPHYFMALAYHKKDNHEFTHAISALETGLKIEPDGPLAPVMKEKLEEIKQLKEKMDRFWGRKK
ncbi:MAG TPA: hypothetical protein ENN03_11490 [bacterium]|nr:hypothetical protein [bacterium]